jgi:PKD repeat protein
MRRSIFFITIVSILSLVGCSKEDETQAPKADFAYVITNPGVLPTNVEFVSLSTDASSYEWQFGDGTLFTVAEPKITHSFHSEGTYTVQLVAIGEGGRDTIWKQLPIYRN